MFIEPFWVLMTRFSSVVMPYELLYIGNARQDKTLSLSYDATPAHFQIFKAIRARHYLFASLGLAVFMANIMAIVSSIRFESLRQPRHAVSCRAPSLTSAIFLKKTN